MSRKHLISAWREPHLQGMPLLVFMAISEHADKTGWANDVTIADIAKKTGSSDRTIHRCINELEIDGYVSIQRRPGKPSRFFVATAPDDSNKSRGTNQWQ